MHAACWAHARRKFFQAVELNPQDQSAVGIVAQMDELFEFDAQAREQALSQEDRQLLRLEKSKPLFELSNNLAENGMRPVAPDQNKQPRSLIGPSPWHEATMGSDNRASS